MKFHIPLIAFTLLVAAGLSIEAHALEQIVRPYQSIRSSAMGGVKITTGLYDENFFGNPARVTYNPRFRMTLFDPMIEINSTTIDTLGDLLESGDTVQKIGSSAGSNNHVRFQTTLPSLYFPVPAEGRTAYAFGLITSTQFDLDLRRTFRIDPQAFTDIGPAFTVGRRFLNDDRLSVGMTAHFTYRVSTRIDKMSYSFADFLRSSTLSAKEIGGDGAMLDFDLGAMYRIPHTWKEFEFLGGASINNLLGGKYSNIKLHPAETGNLPIAQPRTFNFGISARRPRLGPFSNFLAALEFTDIGNNPNGSLFRTVHLGAEARYGMLAPRLGINQGYLAAGLGFLFRFFSLEYATYGEEMSLNPGGYQDRRHALRIALQI
ncbi:MAG TPA: hypothetical protein VJB59_14905 [Bdellovibrionota bacterium]|nr:hypothetical protein [Bdellovibrionota bacterium]